MSVASGVAIPQDVLDTYKKDFLTTGRSKGDKTKFIIFRIADNKKEVVIDDASHETDYEVFRNKLESARDGDGNPAPRYAVYDVEYELPGEGKRSKIVFISWVPSGSHRIWTMVYASTREAFRNALNIQTSIHADEKSEIEWKAVLAEASGGKAGK